MKQKANHTKPNLFEKMTTTLLALGHKTKDIEQAFQYFYSSQNKDITYKENLAMLAFPYPTKESGDDYKEYKEYVRQRKQLAAKEIIKTIDKYLKQ